MEFRDSDLLGCRSHADASKGFGFRDFGLGSWVWGFYPENASKPKLLYPKP